MTANDSPGLKESGLFWLGAIPVHWSVRRIKDIADLRSGDAIDAQDIAAEGTYPVFGGNGLRGYTTSFTHDGHFVLIGRQGALCGNVNYACGRFWATEHAVVATLRDGFDAKWFGELLRTMNLNQYSNAAAQPGLSVDKIKILGLPVPPKAEQRLIGDYLDARCKAIDAALAAKRQQLCVLGEISESIIETAVTRGIDARARCAPIDQDWIDSLPESWEATRIKRVLSRVDYGISISSEREGKHPVLKMGNIQAREIVFSKMEFVDEVGETLLLEKNDLLYNRTNSPDQVGKAALFRGSKDDGVTFASYLVRLRGNHRVDPAFLNYVVNCGGFLGFARKLAIPSVQQSNLNSTRYCRLLIPLPSLREQQAISEYLDSRLGELKQVVATIEQQIETLVAYRKSLIHECVTGQRRMTGAETDDKRAAAHG